MSIVDKLIKELAVEEIHASVQNWIKVGSPKSGPLKLRDPEEVCNNLVSCKHYTDEAPDGPFPGLNICFAENFDFWVLVETGQLIGVHHDEVPSVVRRCCLTGDSPKKYAENFAEYCSAFSFAEFLSLARVMEDWSSIAPDGMNEYERSRIIAKALGWPLTKLNEGLNKFSDPFEFLRLDEQVLSHLAQAEPKIVKFENKPSTKSVDLSLCFLSKWPESLDGSEVQTLNLSWNPMLPWDSLHEKLLELPKLKKLICVGNFLGTADELKAILPDVEVIAHPCYKIDDLVEYAEKPDGVTFLDLEMAEIKRLPKEILKLKDLEVIDLSGNHLLDWPSVGETLAQLPSLKEVIWKDCPVAGFAEGITKIKGLERLDLSLSNKLCYYSSIEIISHLPNLKEVNLGKFPTFPDSHFKPFNPKTGRPYKPKPTFDEFEIPLIASLECVKLELSRFNKEYLPSIVKWMQQLPNFSKLHLKVDSGELAPIGALSELRELHVEGFQAFQLYELLDSFPKLEALSFPWQEMYIKELHSESKVVPFPQAIRKLKQLKRLKPMWLGRGVFNKAYSYAGDGLPDWLSELPLEELEYNLKLYTRDKPITEVPPVIYELTGLKRLLLYNYYEEAVLSPDIAKLEKLEEFVLEGRYSELPAGIKLPSSLKKLEIEAHFDNLGELTQLEELKLSDWVDTVNVEDLAKCTKLRELEIYFRENVKMPATLVNLREFRGHCELPEGMGLVNWKVSADPLTFPNKMPNLRELRWALRGDNWVEQIEKFRCYPRLRVLSLDGSYVDEGMKSSLFEGFEFLDELWLRYTKLRPNQKGKIRRMLPYTKVYF